MAAQNSYMRPPQPAGYVVQNVPSKETPEAVPPQPNKQPNIVPVPVPVMLGPNGTMIPVPMGNGMGLPQGLNGLQQALAPQAPQGTSQPILLQ